MTTPYIISTPPPAVGYVACFIGGGNTDPNTGTNLGDPNGWVICDGQQRTVTDERYAALSDLLNTYLSVNTNNANTIVPPDYRSRLLKGQASGNALSISLGGTGDNVKLTAVQIPPLVNFTFDDPGHDHGTTARKSQNSIGNYLYCDEAQINTGGDFKTSYVQNNTFMSAAYAPNNEQSPIANIMPPYFTINYIIKY